MLPNLLIIGAQKAGTTSLHRYLDAHPDVFMSPIKEVDFFSDPERTAAGVSWYERHFDGVTNERIVGEASPSYTMYPQAQGVPERIAAVLPDVKLIYVVRDPIERMRSQYAHFRLADYEERSIVDALLHDTRYLDWSRYAMQLDRYLAHFLPERILVLRSEELRDDRPAALRRAFAFLGVDPAAYDERHLTTEHHATARGRPRRWLRRLRTVPGYATAAGAAARLLGRERLDRLKYRTIDPGELTIPAEVVAELRSRLAEDQARLRDLMGTLGPAAGITDGP